MSDLSAFSTFVVVDRFFTALDGTISGKAVRAALGLAASVLPLDPGAELERACSARNLAISLATGPFFAVDDEAEDEAGTRGLDDELC